MTRPVTEITSSDAEVIPSLLPTRARCCLTPPTFLEETSLSEVKKLSTRNIWPQERESSITSRFEESMTSMRDTLEKIRKIVNEFRMLVEALHQMTQTFVAAINELSLWFDQAAIKSSIFSSI